jgi:uncharacterized protein (TIGR02145 family)
MAGRMKVNGGANQRTIYQDLRITITSIHGVARSIAISMGKTLVIQYDACNNSKIKLNQMMRTKFLRALVIASLAMVMVSCGKDESNLESANPTNGKTTSIFNPEITYGTMTDQEGNTYKTITITPPLVASSLKSASAVPQTWMAENLRITRYNDGTPLIKTSLSTAVPGYPEIGDGAYCNYNNTKNIDTIATYGRLYNWYAVANSKFAPKGWHVPTTIEWSYLINSLGGREVAGGKLKESGSSHWLNNTVSTNSMGFTALPGGFCQDGIFGGMGGWGIWWGDYVEFDMSSAGPAYEIWNIYSFIKFSDEDWGRDTYLSVRCVKD